MSTLQLSRDSIYNAFYKYGLFIVFGVLVAIFSVLNSNFFSPANAVNLLQQTASTGIAAAGLVFVLVSGGIDISMGSTIFLSSVIVTTLANRGVGIAGSFAVALACGVAVGSMNGFFVAVLNVVPLIVTLASLYIVRGVALALTGV
ncbi:MAG: ABC transporter permease, partial [Spirochaetales bacterium]|nr:ABC transporter permease [Spirochaetales bacterium]